MIAIIVSLMDELTLVLLPGLHGTDALFRPLIERLPRGWRARVVVYPDDQPLGYAELLPLVRSSLPDAGKFILLGESFGGPLALMLAEQNPPGLIGVVLSASFVSNPTPIPLPLVHHLILPVLFKLAPRAIVEDIALGAGAPVGLRRLLDEALAPVPPEVLAHRMRAVFTADARAALRACPVPILYLQASRDRLVSARNLARIRTLVPTVRARVFNTSHCILQTRPDDAIRAIRAFLDDSHAGV